MADILNRYKLITSNDMFKGLDKTYSQMTGATGSDITWSMVSRTEENWSSWGDDLKNLFMSFGIAREGDSDWYEIFGNTDYYAATNMLIASIPKELCGSYIDGSTLKLNVPTGTTSGEYVTFYGSTFQGHVDQDSGYMVSEEYTNGVYGCASCYLFADTKSGTGALPYNLTGTTDHPYVGVLNNDEPNPNSGLESFDWDGGTTLKPHLSAVHWPTSSDGYDVPYGVALLEQGIFVLFDMPNRGSFVDPVLSASTIWSASTTGSFEALDITGGTNTDPDSRTFITFSGTVSDVSASVTFRTVEQSYKMIYFCHAGQGEFNSTSNHTYNHRRGYFTPESADSLWVTEVGLYGDDDTMLAYAKLSEPVEKSKIDTLTFKVELEL